MTTTQTGRKRMDHLVAEVASRMSSGASLADVETTVIGPSALRGDRREALWLYAWSCESRKRRRCEAVENILKLKTSRARRVTPMDG